MEVKVHRRPVVGVLSTGSELVEAFTATAPGKIRDSNRPMLLSLVSEWNVETVDLGICSDDKDVLEATIRNTFTKVDVLITSGGVSMVSHTNADKVCSVALLTIELFMNARHRATTI